MKTKKIELYSKFERFWHWTQGVLVILLGITGFEIHGSFRLFGYETSVRLHSAAAWAFLILIALAIFWMFISKQYKNFIPTSKNIKAQINYYISGIFKGAAHPTKKTKLDKLNPLQRLVYLGLIILVFPVQLISGFLYMYYHYPNKPVELTGLETVAIIHVIGAFLLVVFLIVHLYLITTGTTPLTNLKAMITGFEVVEEDEELIKNQV
ncbi:MAG: cytochrome b/b6 domain-containing protein [Cytophagales bacterium]|nr:cytochrome b/b6 domain-containing protein [Cytophagales bacterium]